MNKNTVYEDFLLQLEGKPPQNPTVAVWNTRSSIGLPKEANNLKDYYDNVDIKLKAQLQPLEFFNDTLIIPGIWPDYGVALEASAFGSNVRFFENNPPHAMHFIKNYKGINDLKSINPKTDGLMPFALEQYEYILKNIPKKVIKKIGYLDGCVVTAGPLEVSSMIVGHENFYLGFYEAPKLIEKLLEIVTDGICKWINELKSLCGEIKIITMIEHLPGQISEDQFIKFGYPYISQIFSESDSKIKLYHNEANLNHILEQIKSLGEEGVDIFHFGDIGNLTIKELRKKTADSILLMGNLHPLEILNDGDIEDVKNASLNCIKEGESKLILSSGGGMAPNTPVENVRTMVDTARKHQ